LEKEPESDLNDGRNSPPPASLAQSEDIIESKLMNFYCFSDLLWNDLQLYLNIIRTKNRLEKISF
jgi:hypothetical protein